MEKKLSTYQKYRAAGLCGICHGPAILRADGIRAALCSECAADCREICKRRYDSRREENRCCGCGISLLNALGATPALCATCAAKNNVRSASSNQRARDKATGVPNTPPLMSGFRVPRLEGGRGVTAVFDGHAVKALEELKRRDDARFEGLGRPWQDRTFRVSRIVRAAIRRFETVSVIARPDGREAMPIYPVKFYLDAATFATVERLTAAGFRSRSACLREIVRQAARPEAVTARRKPGVLPHWSEERRLWND